ncbi:hypothetical protein [Terribacillus halophilus]|uniref:hypothetical protein n=1 Tax=Terribacillus halophilus TaxID=361279 RepID=UPI0009860449|nr:hypothetical protein [Terribacillus halophilus]
MKTWLPLVKKEFRLGLPIFLLSLIIFIIGVAVVGGIGYKFDHILQPIGIFGLVWGAGHFFFLAIYMLYSLGSEKKRMHLWLHNPMHASGLLLAKLLTGTVYLILSLLITSLAAYFGGLEVFIELSAASWLKIGVILSIHAILFSLDLAVYITLAYILFLLLERYMPAFLSGVVVFFGFWVFNGIYFGWFPLTKFYEVITSWGMIDLGNFASSMNFENNIVNAMINFQQDFKIYAGMYLFEAVVVTVIFFITSWLLDKKVEV